MTLQINLNIEHTIPMIKHSAGSISCDGDGFIQQNMKADESQWGDRWTVI